MYLLGYSFGLDERGPMGCIITLTLKIWYAIFSIIFAIMGLIVLLSTIAIINPEISFNLSSSEWAITILIVMAILGIPFLIGLLFGKHTIHYRIGRKLGWSRLNVR